MGRDSAEKRPMLTGDLVRVKILQRAGDPDLLNRESRTGWKRPRACS